MNRNTPEYQVLIQDLKTQDIVGEAPWASLSINEAQNAVASANFSVDLKSAAPNFGAGRSAFIVIRGGIPLGKFLITKIEASYPTRLAVSGIGTLGYLSMRTNRANLIFNDVDQYAIVRALVNAMQSSSNGDLGILVTQGDSGVARTRSYPATEQLRYISMISELSDAVNGFDWRETIDADYNVTLSLSSVGATPSDVVFDLQKNLRTLSAPEDSESMANQFTSFSKSADGVPSVSVTRSSATALARYPQYDDAETTDLPADSTSIPLLADRAQRAVDIYSRPVRSFSFEVESDIDADPSRYFIGTLCRLNAIYGYIQLDNVPILVEERSFSVDSGKETITVKATEAF